MAARRDAHSASLERTAVRDERARRRRRDEAPRADCPALPPTPRNQHQPHPTRPCNKILSNSPACSSPSGQNVGKVILGQTDVIDKAIITILIGQHALIEGVPGVAKNPAGADAGARAWLRFFTNPVHSRSDARRHHRHQCFQLPEERVHAQSRSGLHHVSCWATKSTARRPRPSRRCCRRCRNAP